jgi:transcriptional regulator with PAS, ATPase and Fis domain
MPPVDKANDTEPEESPSGNSPRKHAVLLISAFGERREIRLPQEGQVTIGRGAATSGSLFFEDRLLSREHLRITRNGRGYEIEDLGSRNGTFLDGPRLERPTRLSDGALILFGNHVGVFRRASDAELAALQQDAAAPFGPLPTFSPALALTYARLRKLARTAAELLLVGETGVGKEVCARALHRASGRKGRFVAINCAALPAALVESQLFGRLAGTQPTAETGKPGLVEAAEGGTLLLDEIGDLGPELQAKIFRFLEDRTYSPLGSTRPRRADVRVIASTARQAIGLGAGALHGDLVARLGADPIAISPLRKRTEEILSLVAHFAEGTIREIEPAAVRALCLYGWPLNVRELEKTIANALALTIGVGLRLEHLPTVIRGALQRGAPIEARRRDPRPAPDSGELEQLLKQHDGNVASVARALDRKWNVVWRWVVKYKLRPETFRGRGPS